MDSQDQKAGEHQQVFRLLNVNGEPHQTGFSVHHSLLEVLREQLNLTGTKHGCELGECGTCTVLIDGQPQPSVRTALMAPGGGVRRR